MLYNLLLCPNSRPASPVECPGDNPALAGLFHGASAAGICAQLTLSKRLLIVSPPAFPIASGSPTQARDLPADALAY